MSLFLRAASGVVLILALAWQTHRDLTQVNWAQALSRQGSDAPASSPESWTGYVHGQRHFLGTAERGATYRWIAATQTWLNTGSPPPPFYTSDTAPSGRIQLLPRLYLLWLCAVSWAVHLLANVPLARAAELAALWGPLASHLLVTLTGTGYVWRRHGPLAAVAVGLTLAVFPPLSAQFIPGSLSPRTGAMILAVAAIVLRMRSAPSATNKAGFASAAAAAFSFWLDPAFGFPAILITCVIAALHRASGERPRAVDRPTWFGAGLVMMGWLADGAVLSPAASELRQIHPLYALAWIGLDVALVGLLGFRARAAIRTPLLRLALGAVLVAPLLLVQCAQGYPGWFYSGATMLRLSSLDESVVYAHALTWFSSAPNSELFFGYALTAVAAILLVLRFLSDERSKGRRPLWIFAVVLASVLLLSALRVRWSVPASLVSLGLCVSLAAAASKLVKGAALAGIGIVSLVALAAHKSVAPSLTPPTETRPADVEAMVYRHFAHWLASHHISEPVVSLAPPDCADSLVFHGNVQVLLSSAWESYPGHVAAARILSAPEWTEAEAMIERTKVTHLVLPSWDTVMPHLIQPAPEGKDTFYARLQRWVLPLYLRPIPYQLPNTPGYEGQQLDVFHVTAPQDEALAFSRLAEYFVEMNRPEPAKLVAHLLAGTFPDDPNAAIARGLVAAHASDGQGLSHALAKIATASAKDVVLPWDRRVQRAVLLALGRRTVEARAELEACMSVVERENVPELTPLQAHRLGVLMKRFGLQFQNEDLTTLLHARGAEYARRE